MKVLPPKAGPKPEPPAENLIASLVHPDRKAIVSTAVFSPGGDRLLSAGYPSGIIQVWDVAARKELRRIDILPAQARQSSDYALVTADWKRLYIPVATRTVQTIERDGKRGFRSAWSGEIRVWDLASAQEKTSTAEVKIDNFSFGPAALTVSVGTTVTWINRDDFPHTVVSSDEPKAFKSKVLDTDEKFSFTFSKAGTYPYFCSIHPKMTGTVMVQ